MTIQVAAGTRLGPYEIVSRIGAGGMGEVWRARDSKIGRDVAIKVLPASVTDDIDRLKRFEQEARAAGTLNHPNLVTIYEFGTHAGAPFIAMELLEGETLREKLERASLPPRKALEYGVQIANGLAAAHEKGVVHRDLKPENVFATTDGRIKILDFGLAKLASAANVPDDATIQKGTAPGTVMGTAGYMSPEQVRGTAVDHRTDIFAFGAMLYEMVSGRRAFQRDTAADTMSAILNDDPPDVVSSAKHISPAVDRVVRRCLEKQPGERFQSARDLAFALEGTNTSGARAADHAEIRPARRLRSIWLWITAAAAVLVVVVLSAAFLTLGAKRSESVIRASFAPPDGFVLTRAILSPDGARILMLGAASDGHELAMVREFSTGESRIMPGVERNIGSATWSSDGKSYFFADGQSFRKVAVDTGVATTVMSFSSPVIGSSSVSDGSVLVGTADGIVRLLKDGSRVAVTRRDEAGRELDHRFPAVVPGSDRFLYLVRRMAGDRMVSYAYGGSFDGRLRKQILACDSQPEYANGCLICAVDWKLFAWPFDAQKMAIKGEPTQLSGSVFYLGKGGWGNYSVSNNGVLLYREGEAFGGSSELVSFDRYGRKGAVVATAGGYWDLALSRDGKRLLVQVKSVDGLDGELWLYDVGRSTARRVTANHGGANAAPVFSPDGRTVYFAGGAAAILDVYRQELNGSADRVAIFRSPWRKYTCDISPDGATVLVTSKVADRKYELATVSIADGKLTRFGTSSSRWNGKFSPDGKWIVYVSNDSAREELYLSPINDPESMTRVSTHGGVMPQWSADGTKLYFASADRAQILECDVVVKGQSAEVAEPRTFVVTPVKDSENSQFVVSPDGARIIVNVPVSAPNRPYALVLNWPTLLKRSEISQ